MAAAAAVTGGPAGWGEAGGPAVGGAGMVGIVPPGPVPSPVPSGPGPVPSVVGVDGAVASPGGVAAVAGGVATVVARLAARRGGRVALLTCGAPDQRMLPPRGGRRGLVALQRAVAEGVAADGHAPGDEALGAGMRRIGRLARGPGLVVVISDFRDNGPAMSEPPPWSRELSALAARHDVLAAEVVDPREGELPDAGTLVLTDPESGLRVRADSSAAELRRRFAAAELARRDALRAALRRARARHVEVRTDGDWLRALGRGLR
jgi:uncharacterized protein (DUF58 family)